MTLWVFIRVGLPVIKIPPEEVCPAIVMYGFLIHKSDIRLIIPETVKITTLGPDAVTASLKLSGPESFRLVTLITLPPLPPTLFAPKPSAPGKAGRAEADVVKYNMDVRRYINIRFRTFIVTTFFGIKFKKDLTANYG
jgi:hypothetical protein